MAAVLTRVVIVDDRTFGQSSRPVTPLRGAARAMLNRVLGDERSVPRPPRARFDLPMFALVSKTLRTQTVDCWRTPPDPPLYASHAENASSIIVARSRESAGVRPAVRVLSGRGRPHDVTGRRQPAGVSPVGETPRSSVAKPPALVEMPASERGGGNAVRSMKRSLQRRIYCPKGSKRGLVCHAAQPIRAVPVG